MYNPHLRWFCAFVDLIGETRQSPQMKFIAYLPNFLSVLRMVLSPVFAMLFLQPSYHEQLLSIVVFTIAALTDTCDGYLARRLGAASAYGAFLDPLADKLLIITGLVCLLLRGIIGWWLVVAIVGRDLLVTLLRMDAQRHGLVFKTSWHAKIKTVAQFIALYLGFAMALWPSAFLGKLLMVVMPLIALVTIYTGVEYLFMWLRLRKGIR